MRALPEQRGSNPYVRGANDGGSPEIAAHHHAAAIQPVFAGTYVIEYKTDDVSVEGILVQPAFDAVGLLNYQTTAYPLPQWKGNAYIQADMGNHSLRVQLNYIDGYTDQRGASIFGPNTGALAGASVTTGKNIGSFTTLDAT